MPTAIVRSDIFILINAGDIRTLKDLLPKIDVNVRDSKGNSPLHYAVSKGSLELAELLLDHNFDVSAKNTADGHTPLHWAVGKNDHNLTRLFLEKGNADVLLGDARGYNAIHTAAMNGHLNLLHYLVLHHTSKSPSESETVYGKRCGAKEAVSPAVQQVIDIRDAKGHTALHWASYKGHLMICMYLVRQGADLNATDQLGNTPLHWAAQQDHNNVIHYLTRHGADASLGDTKNQSPIVHAIKKAHLQTARNLMITLRIPWKISELGSRSNIRLSWAAPQLLLLASFITCFWMPFWLWSIQGMLEIALFLVYMTPIIRKTTVRNPVWLSILAGGGVMNALYWMFYAFTVVEMFQKIWVMGPVLLGLVALFGGLFKANRADPGMLRPPMASENAAFVNDLFAGRDPKLCPTCLIRRPIRSKHCSTCDCCTAGFDHHCNWINNCVGYNNYPPFLTFLFGIVFIEFVGIITWSIYLASVVEGVSAWPWSIVANGPKLWQLYPDVLYMLIILWPTWLIQCAALYTQVRNWTDGTNFLERGAPHKFSYMRQEGEQFNPFHLGFIGNMIEKFKPTYDYRRLYYDNDIGNVWLSDDVAKSYDKRDLSV